MNTYIRSYTKVLFLTGVLLSLAFLMACNSIFCDHHESEWIIDVAATLESEGAKHTECTKCGKIIQSQQIPELSYSLSEVKQVLTKSVVKVYCYDYDGTTQLSQGSGFFINRTGLFVTNAHVVKDAYFVKIRTYQGITCDVSAMYAFDYTNSDYALCKALNCFSTPVEFESDVSVGDTVYALGYPNDSHNLSSTQGTVTATNVVDKNSSFIQNTAPIDHGSSGGILANSKGRVLGITTGILENGESAALAYSEIETAINKNYYVSKEPLEWFHNKKEITLNAINFGMYFNISVNHTPLYGGSVRYEVGISLKPIYQQKKISIKGSNLSFSIEIDTNYKFYSTPTYSEGWKNRKSVCYAYIHAYDLSNIPISTATSLFSATGYSQLSYDYDCRVSSAAGTIILYD